MRKHSLYKENSIMHLCLGSHKRSITKTLCLGNYNYDKTIIGQLVTNASQKQTPNKYISGHKLPSDPV